MKCCLLPFHCVHLWQTNFPDKEVGIQHIGMCDELLVRQNYVAFRTCCCVSLTFVRDQHPFPSEAETRRARARIAIDEFAEENESSYGI